MNQEGKNLWVAVAAGLFAAFLMYSYSQEKKNQYDKEFGEKTVVYVAKNLIQELQTIDDQLIEAKEIPKSFVQPGAVTNPETIIGQIASAPIQKGEQLLYNKLLQPGPETGIAMQVSPSKRAITIPVDETRGVAKLIRPGDRVDLIVAIDSGRGVQAKRDVVTMLSDIPVLATGINVVNLIPRTFEYDPASRQLTQIALSGDTKYNSITIEVSPKEAQDLVYLLSTSPGNIFLSLRNPNDKSLSTRLPSSSGEALASGFSLRSPSSLGSSESQSPARPPVNIPPQFRGQGR